MNTTHPPAAATSVMISLSTPCADTSNPDQGSSSTSSSGRTSRAWASATFWALPLESWRIGVSAPPTSASRSSNPVAAAVAARVVSPRTRPMWVR